jgi:hypothetical protein
MLQGATIYNVGLLVFGKKPYAWVAEVKYRLVTKKCKVNSNWLTVNMAGEVSKLNFTSFYSAKISPHYRMKPRHL